jgi:chromosome segregation ATPase
VLDDRIKELKKEITPKEVETRKLKEETKAKDIELQQFNSLNANLGFLVEDLRFKQENMQRAIREANSQIRKNESYIRSFKNAVYWVAQNIDDYEKLKVSVISELKYFVEDHNQKIVVEDTDIQ